ncbi:MAG: Ig-like domain-containing protein [Gemmatimonadaceae bacterium]
MLFAFALLAVQQQPSPPAIPASPIARIAISPATRTMIAGDTLRLSAQALDASGAVVSGASVRFVATGARFEGTVDTLGLVSSGATGTLPVAVVALVPGSRPVVERIEIRMVPGPAARVAISPAVQRVVVGQRLRLEATSYSAAGDARDDRVAWRSTPTRVATVSDAGMVTAVAAGRVTVTASTGGGGGGAAQSVTIDVVPNTIVRMELRPSTSVARTGDVIPFTLDARDANGRAVADLIPSYSMAPGNGMIGPDGKFVGYHAGDYVVTATVGNRVAQASVRLAHRDARRKVTVVGRLPRTAFSTEEVWIHPNGTVAYLGTGGGGDRMYAIDISNPAKPVVTDSIVANTRRVNDIMTTPDGRFLVFTREGAADRRNGIVIASLEDPLHPKAIAEFTEGVTAGVHSTFVYRQERFGTHIYLTNDGTGAMHVIDIGDPYHPREVAQWKTPRSDAGRTLHDIDIQDGLAYLSYWNDGLVILDVGNGMKGGSPSNPVLVSQFKYDLNDLYRQVEAAGGPGFIRGTHTAWRHRNYVFIADEVFPATAVTGARDAAASRAYGRLQVIDVSNLEQPRSVAWYEPEFGGVHNVWVAGDTLYLGAYNAGFRAFDISGELLGDLRAQEREMVHLHTGDMQGNTVNSPMTWGVVVNPRDGLAYVNDLNNGLWIVRIEPRPAVVP